MNKKNKGFLKKFKEWCKSSSFANSFKLKKEFYHSILADFLFYPVALVLVYIFMQLTYEPLQLVNQIKLGNFPAEATQEMITQLKTLKFALYGFAILLFLLWSLSRSWAMLSLYSRKFSAKSAAYYTLVKVLIFLFFGAVSFFLGFALKDKLKVALSPVILLLLVHIYNSFLHGLARENGFVNGMAIGWRIFSSIFSKGWRLLLAYIAMYLVFVAVIYVSYLVYTLNAIAGSSIFILLVFLCLNWARYYFSIVVAKMLEGKKADK